MSARSYYNRTNTYARYNSKQRSAARKIDKAYREAQDAGGYDYEKGESARHCHHCGRLHSALDSDCAIIDAPWYVVATDTFSSRGPGMRGRVSYSVVPCATSNEARQARDFMDMPDRGELKRVRMVTTKPRPRSNVLLCQTLGYRYRAHRWSYPRSRK